MSRVCGICEHPSRSEIDVSLLEGGTLRDIAARFGVSKSALHRHKQHPPSPLVKAETIQEVREVVSIGDKLASLEKETREILQEARGAIGKDNRLALQALARLERQYEIRAKIEGELPGPQVTIYNTPQWTAVTNVLWTELRDHPELRERIAAALEGAGI
jgi:transposase-like protein